MRNKILPSAGLILLFGALLILGTDATALAQSTATLQGTVLDPQGGAVPDAKVTVRNAATGLERNTQTDSAGYFQVPSLPVGLTASKSVAKASRRWWSSRLISTWPRSCRRTSS